MSADNYYTVKFDSVGLKWYVLHGFMSGLEEGIPAMLRGDEPGHEDWHEAVASISGWSEYGLVTEPHPLSEILSVDQYREHLESTIRLAQEHLKWINEESDE